MGLKRLTLEMTLLHRSQNSLYLNVIFHSHTLDSKVNNMKHYGLKNKKVSSTVSYNEASNFSSSHIYFRRAMVSSLKWQTLVTMFNKHQRRKTRCKSVLKTDDAQTKMYWFL